MKVITQKNFEYSEMERDAVMKYIKKMEKKGYDYNEMEITVSGELFPKYAGCLIKTKEVKTW